MLDVTGLDIDPGDIVVFTHKYSGRARLARFDRYSTDKWGFTIEDNNCNPELELTWVWLDEFGTCKNKLHKSKLTPQLDLGRTWREALRLDSASFLENLFTTQLIKDRVKTL